MTFTTQGKAVHDPDGDGMVNFELTNADAVVHHESLGHITIMDTDISFECPLIRCYVQSGPGHSCPGPESELRESEVDTRQMTQQNILSRQPSLSFTSDAYSLSK